MYQLYSHRIMDDDGCNHIPILNSAQNGTNFDNNIIIGDFEDSRIEKDFNFNVISSLNWTNNQIGSDFGDNTLKLDGTFESNQIGPWFSNNIFDCGDFIGNVIAGEFYDNQLKNSSTDFIGNNVAFFFQSNVINQDFENNFITNQFDNNVVNEFYQNNQITNQVDGCQFDINFENNQVNTSLSSLTLTQSSPTQFEDQATVTFINDNNLGVIALWYEGGVATFSQL